LSSIENLILNYTLNKKTESFIKEKNKKILCHNCEKNESEVECKQCDGFFCKECSEKVHEVNFLKSHKIVEIDETNKTEKCSKHNEEVSYIEKDKFNLKCSTCTVEEKMDYNNCSYLGFWNYTK